VAVVTIQGIERKRERQAGEWREAGVPNLVLASALLISYSAL
jgi:hypothetical protein